MKKPTPERLDELRSKILEYLKHAYFNSTTDNIAMRADVGRPGHIHNRDHALPVLENYASEIVEDVLSHFISKEEVREAIGEDKDPNTTGRGFKNGYVTRENKLRAELRTKLGLEEKRG